MANFGLLFETAIVILISYVRPIEVALGTRALASPHFAVPGFSFCAIFFFLNETRKIFMRKGIHKTPNDKLKYSGWLARNSYW